MSIRILLWVAVIITFFAASCSGGDEDGADSPARPSPGASVPATGTPAAHAREPVILVHGWLGSPREMLPLKQFLDANGFHAFIAILPGEDNIENAEYLRSYVTEVEELTDAASVSVVGFSMGGLSLRHYIRFLGGDTEVKRYVSIDSPHYGGPAACLLAAESGGQMCPFSRFLAALNEGDDTPGDVTYTTILNRQSEPAFGRLRDAPREVVVSGEHTALLTAPEVHDAVLEALRN